MLLRLTRIAALTGILLGAWFYYRNKATAMLLHTGFDSWTKLPFLASCSSSNGSAHCESSAVRNTSLLAIMRVHLATLQRRMVHALANADLQHWLEECPRVLQLEDWIRKARSSPIFLLLVPMLLSLIFRRWRFGGLGDRDDRERGNRILNTPPRCLSRYTATAEQEPSFALCRHGRPFMHGCLYDDDSCSPSPPRAPRTGIVGSAAHAGSPLLVPTGLLEELQAAGKVKRRLAAARVIQRWARSCFQPWLLDRASRSRFSAPWPHSQLGCAEDSDDGAVLPTVVDYNDFSEAGLSKPDEAPSSKALLEKPEAPLDGENGRGVDGGMRRSLARRWEAPAHSPVSRPLSSAGFGKLRSADGTF